MFGLTIGAKYVYDKQAYQLSFSNFKFSKEATDIYIPNVKMFYGLDIDTVGLNLPSDVIITKTKVLSFLKKNKITDELYLSYDSEGYTVALNQVDFNSDKFIVFLENQLDIDVDIERNKISIDGDVFYYLAIKDFFVFSTAKIKLNSVDQFERPSGNYHYLINNRNAKDGSFFKHYNDALYRFNNERGDTIKGAAVSPDEYYNFIPSNFDTLRFFGSNRFQDDVKRLINCDENGFYGWVDKSIIHLKKDSLEILIGVQNEFQNLKDILNEQTLALSEDSLLPPPIIKNSYSINAFKSNFAWAELLPFNKGGLNYYSEVNNYNVLGNSVEAMNWFITEVQLGNVFAKKSDKFHYPNNVHVLSISQTEISHNIISKNWVSRTNCFVSKVSNRQTNQNKSADLPLVSKFKVDLERFKIKTFMINDSLQVVLFNDEMMVSYSYDGQVNWSKKLSSPLVSFPRLVEKDSNSYIALFMKNSVDVIDVYNESLSEFPHSFSEEIINTGIIQSASNFRLLIETAGEIVSLNEDGVFTKGWKNQIVNGSLLSNIDVSSVDGKAIINYIDAENNLVVVDKFGNTMLNQEVKFDLKLASSFISGDKFGESLRKYGFSNPYIISQLVSSGQKDSLKINQKLEPTHVKWMKKNDQIYFIVEEFNRVLFFNEFGLLEKEIQKPKPNLKLISNSINNGDVVVFSDFKNKKLYLLDSYGRSICDYPISGESNFDLNYKCITVCHNAQIYVYRLKTY